MGNNLFGANISGQLAAAMGTLLLPVTLTKRVSTGRNPLDPSAGTGLVVGSITNGRGFMEDYAQRKIDGTTIKAGDKQISILGDTLGSIVPEPNDEITIEGKTRTIVSVTRDPDAAMYTCQARG
jgi:hypothetical protein